MSEESRRLYCELLAAKMVQMYDIEWDVAIQAVATSAIQTLINEDPEYVDSTPLSSWAEEIYEEMCRNGR